MRRVAALLWSALLLAFLVEVSPHLVHHAFDPDHVGDECPFATSAERAPTVAAPVAFTVVPARQVEPLTAAAAVALPRRDVAVDVARAPPVSAS